MAATVEPQPRRSPSLFQCVIDGANAVTAGHSTATTPAAAMPAMVIVPPSSTSAPTARASGTTFGSAVTSTASSSSSSRILPWSTGSSLPDMGLTELHGPVPSLGGFFDDSPSAHPNAAVLPQAPWSMQGFSHMEHPMAGAGGTSDHALMDAGLGFGHVEPLDFSLHGNSLFPATPSKAGGAHGVPHMTPLPSSASLFGNPLSPVPPTAEHARPPPAHAASLFSVAVSDAKTVKPKSKNRPAGEVEKPSKVRRSASTTSTASSSGNGLTSQALSLSMVTPVVAAVIEAAPEPPVAHHRPIVAAAARSVQPFGPSTPRSVLPMSVLPPAPAPRALAPVQMAMPPVPAPSPTALTEIAVTPTVEPSKLCVTIIAADDATSAHMTRAGLIPKLQLSLKRTKPLADLLTHIHEKWQMALFAASNLLAGVSAVATQHRVTAMPPLEFRLVPLPAHLVKSLGAAASKPLSDAAQRLDCPAFGWGLSDATTDSPAAGTAAAALNVPCHVILEKYGAPGVFVLQYSIWQPSTAGSRPVPIVLPQPGTVPTLISPPVIPAPAKSITTKVAVQPKTKGKPPVAAKHVPTGRL